MALDWTTAAVKYFEVPHAPDILEILSIVVTAALGASMLHAALRVPGKRTPWDRVGGTMVRYRTSRGSTGAVP
jgi:hypothetical protein